MRSPLAALLLPLLAACSDPAGPADVADLPDLPDAADAADDDGGDAGPDEAPDAADGEGDALLDEGGDAGTDWTSYDGEVPDLVMMSRDEHLESCLRTRACVSENPQQLATCTSAFPNVNGREIGLVLSEVARCVAAAGADCDAVRACLTHGEPLADCVPLRTPDRCDGSVLRQCSRASAHDFVFDCASLGLACRLDLEGTAVCGLGLCDPDAFRWSCRGDVLVACENGVIVPVLCRSAGLACVEDSAGGRCAGTGGACTEASDPRRCEDDWIRGCISGYSAAIDCGAVIPRWTCGAREGTWGCVQPGSECTALPLFGSDIDEACDGEAVVSCLDGYVESFSCAAYGLGACVQDCAGGDYCAARCSPGP